MFFRQAMNESPSRITSSKILYNSMSICRTVALSKYKKLFKVNVINVSDFMQLKYCISKHFTTFLHLLFLFHFQMFNIL